MKIIQAFVTLNVLLSIFLSGSLNAIGQETNPSAPRVFIINARTLVVTKRRVKSGDKTFAAALKKLEADARRAMQQSPLSVVTKAVTPPSGDKHDYLSQAPYFWPNPNTADGLPYIRRDGERNPELDKITDHRALDQMIRSVHTLALA